MPISAPDRPSRIAALPNVAAVALIRMSEARHSARPAPTHGPLTAATTGCGSVADGLRQRGHGLLESQPVDGGVGGVEHAGPEVAYVDAGAEAPPGAGQDDRFDVVVVSESPRVRR